MTVLSIETVQDLIEEMQSDGTAVGSVWEFTNKMSDTKQFAVFPASQFCDIHQSPNVKDPELIWWQGEFIGKYENLNSEVEREGKCTIPCPDCQEPKDQQPPAGDLTKRVRTESYDPKWEHTVIIRTEDRDALCNRLDRAESINADLLEACKGLMEKADNGSADFDDPEPGSIYLKAIAAISKAKKE